MTPQEIKQLEQLMDSSDADVYCTGCGGCGQRVIRGDYVSCCPERRIIHEPLANARPLIKKLLEENKRYKNALELEVKCLRGFAALITDRNGKGSVLDEEISMPLKAQALRLERRLKKDDRFS